MAAGYTDSQCRLTAPADGTYTLRVEDRLASRGGPAFAYRLRIDVARSDFRLLLAADLLNLVRGKSATLKIDVDSVAPIETPIDLSVEGLPSGVTVAPLQIAAKAKQAELKFTTPDNTPIRAGRLAIRGRTKIGEREIVRTAALAVRRGEPAIDHVGWAVALPTPFKFLGSYQLSFDPRGGYVQRHYTLLRGGYQGPLEIMLADRQLRHLQGVTGPTITVPAGAEAFDYRVYLPPWMDLGRTSRTCLMAVGVIQDFDGSQHTISFATQEQNEQIVIRVSSGLLTASLDRESILANPGGRSTIQASVSRDTARPSPVKLELIVPPHIHGVRAEPVTVGASETSRPLTIEFDADCGPFNMPLALRATTIGADRPAVAEARLEIVASR